MPYPSNPGITLKYYDYGPLRLLPVLVVGALQQAINDRKEHDDDLWAEMGSEERQYESGDVVILLHPEPGM